LIKPRLALVGDAAHNVHPLAGQGVNLGFRDARELTAVLAARGAQQDCGDYYLLRRYERARREDIAAMQLTTDTLQRLFNNEVPLLGAVRNFGLRLANRGGIEDIGFAAQQFSGRVAKKPIHRRIAVHKTIVAYQRGGGWRGLQQHFAAFERAPQRGFHGAALGDVGADAAVAHKLATIVIHRLAAVDDAATRTVGLRPCRGAESTQSRCR